MKQISEYEIYFLIKYIKSVLWRVAKRLSYIEDARCLNVNKSRRKWEDNIKVGFICGVKCMDGIHLSQNEVRVWFW